jgi:hypothetical protein
MLFSHLLIVFQAGILGDFFFTEMNFLFSLLSHIFVSHSFFHSPKNTLLPAEIAMLLVVKCHSFFLHPSYFHVILFLFKTLVIFYIKIIVPLCVHLCHIPTHRPIRPSHVSAIGKFLTSMSSHIISGCAQSKPWHITSFSDGSAFLYY